MIQERTLPGRVQAAESGFTLSIADHWKRFALLPILLLATILNFYDLSREGYANAYYAAAVRSMGESWHNFFFNAFDPGGFVSLDKPPLGFWLQVASTKVFGYNGVALMLPQALAGVLSVALLYYLVRRIFGTAAGLLAALALAITPISVVANRNNIVDGTLVFIVLLGAWAVSRAVETGKLRWLLLCAVFVGLGFNVKMLQAYLVLPAFGLAYLLGTRLSWWRRIVHLSLATVVLLVVSLSWVVAVDLTPASQRPWVGSTTNSSELSLAIGYNGLQRLTGNSSVSGTRSSASSAAGTSGSSTNAPAAGTRGPGGNGGPGGVGENGPTGALRLLDTQLGGQTGWLLPLAVIGFFVGIWRTRRWPPDPQQTALLVWGMWLLTMGVFFSVAGFFHTYYLVMIAPAIAALVGIGVVSLWQTYRQSSSKIWWLLPTSLLALAAVQAHLLTNYPAWSRWLTPLIVGLSLLGALLLILLRLRANSGKRFMLGVLLLGVAGLLAAPAVWSVESVQAADSGLTPRAGPSGSTGSSGPGGFAIGGGRGAFQPSAGSAGAPTGPPGTSSGSTTPPGPPSGNPPSSPPGGNGSFRIPSESLRTASGGLGGSQVNKGLLRYLAQHLGSATYLFATESAGTAEPYIIATGKAVMAMGGFTGSDPILTSTRLTALVKAGVVRYFLLNGGGFGGPGGSSNGTATSWVQAHCTAVPASKYTSASSGAGGSGTLYDCATTS
jgi:4-amino-4-deoxy-L-arabinose transferase-like glycosyltransferase